MATKKIIAMNLIALMMMALLAAHVRATEESDIDVANFGSCAKECALQCLPKIFPGRIAACTTLCLIGCKLNPPPALFDCTTSCANSVINTYNPTDAEKINNIVGSCYKTCKYDD